MSFTLTYYYDVWENKFQNENRFNEVFVETKIIIIENNITLLKF